ncbi:EscU/YscU/HrcU family type III secretion system export apparatus switch protein [Chitinispirillales bacterium ANBcel5]|uniref:EscU/YscU/HrcU family type III secretion system export apparatus switch protein n=1 Tax=Cellulosispirillum alkaliphilum TaxID=3039283 RepID=UPI002A4FF450|nr:EscU/YscU/HrcU family type III secretion system export apparatus switch protein [Chitinispirillales bacterium ANBcel5]
MKRNKRDTSVALKYNEENDRAPKVVAKGHGESAQKIREAAAQNKIPVHRDDGLVELLEQIDIDSEIPPQLYAAVAEILCWIYKANNSLGKDEVTTE